MHYVYAKLGLPTSYRFDFGLFRVGGVGLGNLLITWGRAEILALQYQAKMINPTWPQICPGPIIRFESDSRLYSNIFVSHTSYACSYEKFMAIHRYRQYSELHIENALQESSSTIIVEGIEGMFKPLQTKRDYLIDRLRTITNMEHRFTDIMRNGVLGVHIRLGDFKKLGWDTNLGWYIETLRIIYRNFLISSIEIYTDEINIPGLISQIEKSAPGIPIAFIQGSAMYCITRLASSQFIIGSHRSTFSMWAYFLGNAFAMFPDIKYVQECGLSDNRLFKHE